jgi:metacaspase-1
MNKMRDAEVLYAGAQSFFKGLQHMGEGGGGEEGLGDADVSDYRGETRRVIMYSGCRDDQTSADADIAGSHVGVC